MRGNKFESHIILYILKVVMQILFELIRETLINHIYFIQNFVKRI